MIYIWCIMLSKTELKIMTEVSHGTLNIDDLAKGVAVSKTQVYRAVTKLKQEGIAVVHESQVVPAKNVHAALLTEILEGSNMAYAPLADSGIAILAAFKEPRTVKEVAAMTQLNASTVTRKLTEMQTLGMVRRTDCGYVLNQQAWPRLSDFVSEYQSYLQVADSVVPAGGRLIRRDGVRTVFASHRKCQAGKTAFSRFADFGIPVAMDTDYYSTGGPADLPEVFTDALAVARRDGNRRLLMLCLFLYLRHRSELQKVADPAVADMEAILRGEERAGWLPRREMALRAPIYGVSL